MTKPVLCEDLGILYPSETSKYKKRYGMYKCKCGNIFKTQSAKVASGHTKSCGCLQKEKAAEAQRTHGGCGTRLYGIWKSMRSRTKCKTGTDYITYKARGIKICEQWADYSIFREWALGNGYEEHLTIDREDNNKDYSPENCRWTTMEIQAQNTRELRSNNTSGYRVVSWHKETGKWCASIGVSNKQVYLGVYVTKEEANSAYYNYVVANNLNHEVSHGR